METSHSLRFNLEILIFYTLLPFSTQKSLMKNSHTSFRKSLRRFHNQHRRQYRICREYAVGSVKAVMMSLGLFSFVLGAPGAALAANLPTGGQVVSGVVDINQVDANNMIVTQGSHSAIVNWESFDIGQDAFVNVVQPNVDASMLARVEGINPSEIYGSLSANGHFYLVNPNGILFGENAQINIYSFIASTSRYYRYGLPLRKYSFLWRF